MAGRRAAGRTGHPPWSADGRRDADGADSAGRRRWPRRMPPASGTAGSARRRVVRRQRSAAARCTSGQPADRRAERRPARRAAGTSRRRWSGARRSAGGAITPAADVFSLGSVALFCLTGRSAWPADDPADVLIQSAAGLWPDLPDDAGPAGLVGAGAGDAARRTRPAAQRGEPGRPARPVRRAGADHVQHRADSDARLRGSVARVERRGCAAGARIDARPVAGTRSQPGPTECRRPTSPTNVDRPAVIGSRSGDCQTARVPANRRRRRHPACSGGLTPPAGVGGRDPRAGPTGAPRSATAQSVLVRTGIALLAGLLIAVVALQVGVWWTGWEQPGHRPRCRPGMRRIRGTVRCGGRRRAGPTWSSGWTPRGAGRWTPPTRRCWPMSTWTARRRPLPPTQRWSRSWRTTVCGWSTASTRSSA